jgi:hypothetical protein
MNWRGRPLSSHEVIVNSIAATTTGTGLTVRAELDPGSYPTGVEISDAQLAAVPLMRHRFHGDWNYTVGPVPAPSPDAAAAEPRHLAGHGVDRLLLSHPDLTGMPRERLDRLVDALAEAHDAGREQARRQRRGAERRRSRGAGPKPKLDTADRILATVLYLRRLCTQAVLGELFAVDRGTITDAVNEIRPLLAGHGHIITPSTARFPAAADLLAYLAAEGTGSASEIKPAC